MLLACYVAADHLQGPRMPMVEHGIEMPDPEVRFYRDHFHGQGLSAFPEDARSGDFLEKTSPLNQPSYPCSKYLADHVTIVGEDERCGSVVVSVRREPADYKTDGDQFRLMIRESNVGGARKLSVVYSFHKWWTRSHVQVLF